jgi:hypothetical protein
LQKTLLHWILSWFKFPHKHFQELSHIYVHHLFSLKFHSLSKGLNYPSPKIVLDWDNLCFFDRKSWNFMDLYQVHWSSFFIFWLYFKTWNWGIPKILEAWAVESAKWLGSIWKIKNERKLYSLFAYSIFPCEAKEICSSVRLIQTGKNSMNSDYLSLASIEFYETINFFLETSRKNNLQKRNFQFFIK